MESFDFKDGKIGAVTQPKEYQGVLQIGFNIDGRWYNVSGTKGELEVVLKTTIVKGNVIKFLYNQTSKEIKDIEVTSKTTAQENTPTTDGSFADDMVKFEDLLNAAHEKNIAFSIKTEIITIETTNKYALFKARVEVSYPDDTTEVFEAHGDASASNLTSLIAPHYIRMAETRAIARALRWYTNNTKVADVETENGETIDAEADEIQEQAKP